MPAGILTVMRRLARTLPRPLHFGQGSLTILPVAVAGRAGTCHAGSNPAWCSARRRPGRCPYRWGRSTGCVPSFAPVPWHSGQVSSRVILSSLVAALGRLLEGQRHVVPQVVALHGAVRARRTAGRAAAEELAEDVAEPAEALPKPAEPDEAARAIARAACGRVFMAELVVARALLGIGEHLVGLVDLLELLLGVFIARVDVRMQLLCQLPIGLFDALPRRRSCRRPAPRNNRVLPNVPPLTCATPDSARRMRQVCSSLALPFTQAWREPKPSRLLCAMRHLLSRCSRRPRCRRRCVGAAGRCAPPCAAC